MRWWYIFLLFLICQPISVLAQEEASSDTTQTEEETFIMDAAKIQGKVESNKNPVPLQKQPLPLNLLQPNPDILQKPLQVDQADLLATEKSRPSIGRALFWSTAAIGVGTGVGAWVQHNQGSSDSATTLALISATSLLTSGIFYIVQH